MQIEIQLVIFLNYHIILKIKSGPDTCGESLSIVIGYCFISILNEYIRKTILDSVNYLKKKIIIYDNILYYLKL